MLIFISIRVASLHYPGCLLPSLVLMHWFNYFWIWSVHLGLSHVGDLKSLWGLLSEFIINFLCLCFYPCVYHVWMSIMSHTCTYFMDRICITMFSISDVCCLCLMFALLDSVLSMVDSGIQLFLPSICLIWDKVDVVH